MRDLKYIIVALINHPSFKTAIIFNGMINHCDMVPKGFKAVSAGFCIINTGIIDLSIIVHGGSESLKLESRPFDAIIIRKTLERTISFEYEEVNNMPRYENPPPIPEEKPIPGKYYNIEVKDKLPNHHIAKYLGDKFEIHNTRIIYTLDEVVSWKVTEKPNWGTDYSPNLLYKGPLNEKDNIPYKSNNH